jgi:hypothetical protein
MTGPLSIIFLACYRNAIRDASATALCAAANSLAESCSQRRAFSGVSIIPCRPFLCHLFRIFVFPQSYKFEMAQVIGRRPFRVLESRHYNSSGLSQMHFSMSAAVRPSPHRPFLFYGRLANGHFSV